MKGLLMDPMLGDLQLMVGERMLTFTTLWGNSAVDILVIFSYFSQKTGFDISYKFIIVSIEDDLHEMLTPVLGKNKKNISKCHLLKLLPKVLIVTNIL